VAAGVFSAAVAGDIRRLPGAARGAYREGQSRRVRTPPSHPRRSRVETDERQPAPQPRVPLRRRVKPGLAAGTERRLRIFISSTMSELRDLREVLTTHLQSRGLAAWVFEDDGARPENVVETSLKEVERADVYVGVFWQRYGEVTVEEYRLARRLGKPCFVYVRDRELVREPALEAFLKAEVYDPAAGVTYDFFEKVQPLAERAADDILAWIVRRHREMTAALAEAQVSWIELERLRDEVARLTSISRDPLPQGTAVDSLARDMRGWFGTLNYGIERELERGDEAFEWMINIPVRRGFDRVLVRGIEGEAELGHLKALEEAVTRERADEGWLVSRQRVSQAVRAKAESHAGSRLYCYTFDELLDEDADFSGYLQWLEREVVSRGIDRLYIPVAATKKEFDLVTGEYLGEGRYDGTNGWLEGYINRWLDDPSKEHVSVLGEFGTGKTWFALHYAYVAIQRYKAAKESGSARPRLPLVIPLRDYARAVSVESLFSEFFFRKYEIPLPGYSAFEQLNRMGKLLLIFDGFDEMAARVDRQQMINNFWELARVVVPGSKAILTCRTEHFPEAKEGRALLNAELKASTANLTGEPPQFEVLELSQFDDEQVRRLLAGRTTPEAAELIFRNPQILDLARRPVMTELILDALPEIEAGKPVDLSRIYYYATTRKMRRDIETGRTFTSLADKLYFLCEIAWEMLSTDRMSLNYRLFPDRLANLFGDVVREQKDLDHWHYDMMRSSMLIRNADGDYQPAHRSLLEFFVAFKLTAELGLLAPDLTEATREQSNVDAALEARDHTWSEYFRRSVEAGGSVAPIAPLRAFRPEPLSTLVHTFGRAPLTKAVLDLMEKMLVQDPGVGQVLAALIEQTRDATEDTGYVGGNAATLWIRLDRCALAGRDCSKARLSHADFTAGDLTGCNLQGALLQHAQFVGTILERADLRDADLNGARVSEVTHVTAVAVSPDDSMYAAGHGDGTISVYEMRTGAEIATWRAHRRQVNVVRWSPDGQFIASGGEDGSLALWTGASGNARFYVKKAHANWVLDVAFDPRRERLISVGGHEPSPIKMWSQTGQQVDEFHRLVAQQANQLSVSPDGTLLLVSYFNPQTSDLRSSAGFALFEIMDAGLTLLKQFKTWVWHVVFSNDGSFFAAGAEENGVSGIGIYDTRTRKRLSFIASRNTPRCFAPDDSVLATATINDEGCTAELWPVGDYRLTAVLRFGPKSGHDRDFRQAAVCFARNGSVLIGGADDGAVRLWDSRLWLTPEGEPGLDVQEASPPGVSREKHNEAGWPEGVRKAKISVPEGLVPNPDLGKLLRVQEQKVLCNGLRLAGARGLSNLTIEGVEFAPTADDATKTRQIIRWFSERGAIITN
jgi:NACHT-associated inactive restriction endonuclease/uncharacterized protein DUF4062/WD40 domain-containing protein/pentapeptide repeat protein/NACHT domain-containing protein